MRWVSWAAVSSLPQAKKVSIDDQLAENRQHAERHGGSVVAELVVPGESRSIVLFDDAARKMQAYAELKRLVDARAFDVLVYLDRSRLGRKASLSMAVVELCQSNGIAIYETDNPPASITATGTHDEALIGAIKSVGAQQEIEKMKRRRESGMAGRIKKGLLPGLTPYGYVRRFQPDGSSTVVVDDTAAATVRRIFALYLDGLGTPAIADKLTQEGRQSATGQEWYKTSVGYVIRNVWTYAGYAQVNKVSRLELIRHPGQHPAIIDDEMAAQVEAESMARRANRRLADTPFLLSGVAYCVDCGQPMTCCNQDSRYKDKTYCYQELYCPRHRPRKYASYRKAVEDLRASIEAMDAEDIEDMIQIDAGLGDMLMGQIAEQEARIEKLRAALQRADDVFFDGGAMDDDRYRRQVDRLDGQIQAAQREIGRLRQRYTDEADTARRRKRIETVSQIGLAKLDGDVTEANAWLRRYIRLWVQDGAVVGVEIL